METSGCQRVATRLRTASRREGSAQPCGTGRPSLRRADPMGGLRIPDRNPHYWVFRMTPPSRGRLRTGLPGQPVIHTLGPPGRRRRRFGLWGRPGSGQWSGARDRCWKSAPLSCYVRSSVSGIHRAVRPSASMTARPVSCRADERRSPASAFSTVPSDAIVRTWMGPRCRTISDVPSGHRNGPKAPPVAD